LDGAASHLASAADAMKELKDEKKQLEKENGSAKDLEKRLPNAKKPSRRPAPSWHRSAIG